jgi:CheY-like chemotaxis protein
MCVFHATVTHTPLLPGSQLVMTKSPSRAPTILVAEDSAEQRALYVEVLTLAGYRVLEAGDGAEALASVRRERPSLVLMDVTMPGTSGWNAVRALREDPTTRDIPIIVVTGLSNPWDRDASLAAGCDAFLAKPVPPPLLLAEVRKFLRA